MPGFLRDNMSVFELFDGVATLLPPTEDELRRSDEIAAALEKETGKPVPDLEPELFLLKIGIAGQYALGLLETLGMEEGGLAQFFQVYQTRLADNFATFFKSTGPQAAALLKRRLLEYETALHEKHAENPHLRVADLFTRYVGAADDPRLISLCLDVCKDLNQRFVEEVTLVQEDLRREKRAHSQN